MSNESDIKLQIEGMTCAHCAITVTKVLEKSGATNPMVNYTTGEASFHLKSKSALPNIIKGLDSAGYKASAEEEGLSHDHSHGHNHSHGSSSLEKKFYFTLPFTVILFFSHMAFSHDSILNNPLLQLVLCIPVFIIGCIYFGRSAWGSVKVMSPNMDVLIMIGSASAFIYSLAGMYMYYGTHEVHNYLFFETTATIITLVLLGNVIEHRSVKQTTSAISELNKLQITTAKKIVQQNGQEAILNISAKEIKQDDILLVNTGDKIPVDGSIIFGNISVDESMITGESIPVEKEIGSKLIGGTLVVNGNIKMVAERVGKDTVLSQIIEMVKNAQQSKPQIQKLGDKVSAIFVPAVLVISLIAFMLNHFILDISFQRSLMHSIAVLVISCPCAMGLATPTAVMVGIGRAAKKGILIKTGSSLEEFAKVKTLVFDKTGTLTTGKFKIRNIDSLADTPIQEIESVLYNIEYRSSHPIAKSVVSELKSKTIAPLNFKEIKEIKGVGMEGVTNEGTNYKIGSYLIASSLTKNDSHTLYVLKNGNLVATIDLSDEIKESAMETISFFKAQGINSVLLSGDTKKRCEAVAQPLGITTVYSEKMPEQKLKIISDLASQGHVAMVGDGINDAPALAKASVGISIGNATQVAIHSAQIVLLNHQGLEPLQTAYLISKHSLKTIKQNLFWAFFYNVVAIPFAAMGLLSPMIGALTMAFSDVVVIGNSIRLRTKKLK